ncbi:TonB-dependent receptor plug domain-containing protein [Idiomarina sp. HP20-50]|uniref:TonB-dependent receptor plug domain-containing protein n=1 Tax=Idiomarina sp. HP20-50 TaxID=3070813 RepID=UPI00294AA3D6|nr:TonB-dependent receptor [Idiomarina sp. HP20-50]MDV6317014.1 TonB-dependent receptor [Idiomarina sp. HP20-50]
MNNKLFRRSITAVAVASTLSFPALAQDNTAEQDKIEKIEVTGSRLSRTNMETPVPVTVIGREDIVQTGAINVAQVLNMSPVAIAGSDQSNSAFSTTTVGLNTTELRNMGAARTLVLLNGKRFVSGVDPSTGYAVDLNAIPTAMIERIEILKSASSAVYGSDAVAGVVNIITRKNFDGIEINAQTGISGQHDRQTQNLNLTTGKDWDDGNAWFSFGIDNDEGLKSTDRSFSALDRAVLLDENGNEYIGEVLSSYPPQGRITTDNNSYDGDGTPYSGGFNRASARQLVTPLERRYVAAEIRQNLTNDLHVFGSVHWNSAETQGSTIEPTPFNIGEDLWMNHRVEQPIAGLSVYSPLVPDLLRQNLLSEGIDNLNETTFVRRMSEFGARSTDVTRDTLRIASGFTYNINYNWTWDSYMTWGRTNQEQLNGGQINTDRARLALNVVEDDNGNLVCANPIARMQGCAPLNLFGEDTISAEAVDYVSTPAKATGTAEQFVVQSVVSGDLPYELEGGFVGLAGGLEYREEKGTYSPGDLAQTGASSTNLSEPTNGSFNTKDVFVETRLPILTNLSVDLAARYSDHSATGAATTWNIGTEYEPVDGFKLRASAAKAIRTPNISDLYSGAGETFATVTDPCSGITAATAGNIAENCRSITSVNNRIQSNGEFELTTAEVQSTGGMVGGNPNVQEETAETYSVGAIWQINDSLSATVDYYDITVDDAIAITGRSTVLQRCYSVAPENFDASCNDQVFRSSEGVLVDVDSSSSNENIISTSGVDLELNYGTTIADGQFTADLIWNYTDEYSIESIYDGSVETYEGSVTTPNHRANLNLAYAMNDLTFSWRMRYWDSSKDSTNGYNYNFTDFAPLQEFNNVGSVTYHDISARYLMSKHYEFTVGVRNAFDKQPPILPQGTVSGGTGINTASEAYDVTGRYYFAGVSISF